MRVKSYTHVKTMRASRTQCKNDPYIKLVLLLNFVMDPGWTLFLENNCL